MKQLISVVVALVVITSAYADPPDTEQVQKAEGSLKQEEARIAAYEKYRAEIVANLHFMDQAEFNWLAQLADADHLDQETMALLDEAGLVFTTAMMEQLNAAVLLEKTYGITAPANADAAPLGAAMLKMLSGFEEAARQLQDLKQRFPRSKKWAEWEKTLRKSGKTWNLNLSQNHAYLEVTRLSMLNAMAATLEAGIIEPKYLTGLDGLGPLFIEALLLTATEPPSEATEKFAAEVNAQCESLKDAWHHVLAILPPSERSKKWSEEAAKAGNEASPDVMGGSETLERLMREERAAKAEKAKQEKK